MVDLNGYNDNRIGNKLCERGVLKIWNFQKKIEKYF